MTFKIGATCSGAGVEAYIRLFFLCMHISQAAFLIVILASIIVVAFAGRSFLHARLDGRQHQIPPPMQNESLACRSCTSRKCWTTL